MKKKIFLLTVSFFFVFVLSSCEFFFSDKITHKRNSIWKDENDILSFKIIGFQDQSGNGTIVIKNETYDVNCYFTRNVLFIVFIDDAPTPRLLKTGVDGTITFVKNNFKYVENQIKVDIDFFLSEDEGIYMPLVLFNEKLPDSEIDAKKMFDCTFTSEFIEFYSVDLKVTKGKLIMLYSRYCNKSFSFYGINRTNDSLIKVIFEDNRLTIYNIDEKGEITSILLSGTYTTKVNVDQMTFKLDPLFTINDSSEDIIFNIHNFGESFPYE
ncbi:MAG: hypothetical protein LBV58_05115 [Acholeplasmatales bacterium]|jgi:hypothetical protein|nr:hypothetical protein [Acholeplasmatales bacterium]